MLFRESTKRGFMAADLDKSGLITRKDFKLALEYSIFFHRLAAVLDAVDSDGDGRLTQGEFVALARQMMVDQLELPSELAMRPALFT